MKYKEGDKVKFVKDCAALGTGDVIPANSVWEVMSVLDAHYGLECPGKQLRVMIERKIAEDYCEKINTAPSITKRINDKHNILNGLLNSDGSVDGEKLMEKLEENQVKVTNGVVMSDRPQRPTGSASTPDGKTKGSHYEKAAMQPLEVAQRMFTKEQFKAILAFQVMKYRLRKEYKGEKESDEYKALQYCYWLELANKGITIDPSKDKVPTGYEYKGVIL